MNCPYCESENWTRDGNFLAEEWISDEHITHYVQCVCLDCKRHFLEKVVYKYESYSILSKDQFEARYIDGMRDSVSVWTCNGAQDVDIHL